MLGHGVYNIKSNIQASTVVQVAIGHTVISGLTTLCQRSVDLHIKQLKPCHLELAVDFVFQESDLSPNEFFCEIYLLLQILKLCSQSTFFCLELLNTFLPVLPSFKPCLSLLKCCDSVGKSINFLLNCSYRQAIVSFNLADFILQFSVFCIQLVVFSSRFNRLRTPHDGIDIFFQGSLFFL